MNKFKSGPSLVDLLSERNNAFARKYRKSSLMRLINSEQMKDSSSRSNLLNCIQVFSDHFQKVVMLRNVFCEDKRFLPITTEHLNEEFGHNQSLMQDRHNAPPIWDPVLDATSSWFVWKMFSLDNDEKTVLVHLVLETSANIFFQAAHKVMAQYGETDYFKVHSEADEKHEQMGRELITNVALEKHDRLFLVQQQGWDVLVEACDRIAMLTQKTAAKTSAFRQMKENR